VKYARGQAPGAALDVKTGKVHDETAARHISEQFVDFLGQTVGVFKSSRRFTS
jgi:hypothetical protein